MFGRLHYSIVLLFFLFFGGMKEAAAFTCRTSDGRVIPAGGSSTPVPVWVNIGPNLKDGKNEISSLGQVTCQNDIYNWIDYLDLVAVYSSLITLNNLNVGVTLGGVDYDLTKPEVGVRVLEVTRNRTVTVPLDIYIRLDKKPGRDILVKKGEKLASLMFSQRNNQAGCPYCGPYNWDLYANNDAYFTRTSCTINDAKQINIDFGRISQDNFTESTSNAIFKKEESIRYWCEDDSATQDILVRLVANPSGFSTSAIRTTNSDIGIVMLYKGVAVKPNETFRSKIINGIGNDTLTFVPIKSTRAPGYISTGPFSGSATLVFSAP